MTLGRPIPPLQLSREERETLERWVRRPTWAQPCRCERGSAAQRDVAVLPGPRQASSPRAGCALKRWWSTAGVDPAWELVRSTR
jgi:hypothetical protein